MTTETSKFVNFIGIFGKTLPETTCNRIIDHFNLVQESTIFVHHNAESNDFSINTATDNHNISQQSSIENLQRNNNEIISSGNLWIFEELKNVLWKCFNEYSENYGIIKELSLHTISDLIKINNIKIGDIEQKWDCHHNSVMNGDKILTAIFILNDCNNGGETEFLYQGIRINSKQGTVILFPSGFTHTFRNNIPLDDTLYIAVASIILIK